MIGPQFPSFLSQNGAAKPSAPPHASSGGAANGGDFAGILTQFTGQTGGDRGAAASVRPAIGSDARSFAASPLLVRTALTAPASAPAPNAITGAHAPPTAQPVLDEAALPAALTQALGTLLGGMSALHSLHSGFAQGATALATPDSARASAPLTAPLSGSPPPAVPVTAPAAPPRGGAPTETGLAATSARTAPHSPRGQGGSWMLHCLPVEGGFRLLVKLIRLPDDQRSELETRLRDLFSEFGLNLRDLDLRETGTGGD